MRRLTVWHHAFWGKVILALVAAAFLSAAPALAQSTTPQKPAAPAAQAAPPGRPGAGPGQRTGGLCYWGRGLHLWLPPGDHGDDPAGDD